MAIQFTKTGKSPVSLVDRSVPKADKKPSRTPQAPKSKAKKPEKALKAAVAAVREIEKRGRGRPTSSKSKLTLSVETAALVAFQATGPNWRQAMAAVIEEAAARLSSSLSASS